MGMNQVAPSFGIPKAALKDRIRKSNPKKQTWAVMFGGWYRTDTAATRKSAAKIQTCTRVSIKRGRNVKKRRNHSKQPFRSSRENAVLQKSDGSLEQWNTNKCARCGENCSEDRKNDDWLERARCGRWYREGCSTRIFVKLGSWRKDNVTITFFIYNTFCKLQSLLFFVVPLIRSRCTL